MQAESIPAVVHSRRGRLRRHASALLVAAFALLALALVVLGGVGWVGSERAIHPDVPVEAHALTEYGFANQTETVHFPSLDGVPLAAWFLTAERTPAAAVVLLAGYGHARAGMLPHANYLHRAGYNVLLLDFRGRGESGGGEVTIGAREPLDVRAAVSYLLTRSEVDPHRIAAQGISLGAASGILALAADPRIAAVVSEAAFTTLTGTVARSFTNFIHLPSFPFAPVTVLIVEHRLYADAGAVRPIDAISRAGQRPVLIIDDALDEDVPLHSGQQLYAAASGPKELWTVPGAQHGQGYAREPQEYERRVLAFYARFLPAQ
jgi:dipeptidyl aminopeptidase/acylaminoacyl peptidase